MLRLLIAVVLSLLLCAALFWAMAMQGAGGAADGSHAPQANVSPLAAGILALVFLTPFLVWLQGWWVHSMPRWWLRRGGAETGPYSVRNLGQMMRGNQLQPTDEVRTRWNKTWRPFTVLARPAPRFAAGLIGLVLGAVLGGAGGMLAFGQVQTPLESEWVQPEWLVEKPPPSKMKERFVDLGKVAAEGAAKSYIPGVMESGAAGKEALKLYEEKNLDAARSAAIDKVRLSILGGALALAGLFAASVKETYRLVSGQRLAPEGNIEETLLQAEAKLVAPPAGAAPADAKLRFHCIRCGKPISVDRAHAGKKVQCRGCGEAAPIPER